MRLHIDGDIIVYRAGFAAEKGGVVEPVENALYNVKSIVEGTAELVGSDDVVLYLSGEGNFRESIATIKKYKGNRDPTHKPVHGPAIKEYMMKKYRTVVSKGEEADDRIGIEHYAMWEEDPMSSVIVSIDKDLDMIPGLHYNFVKDESYYVDPETAMYYFYRQLLMGDQVDNIQGVPGVGPKKAEKILDGCVTEVEMFGAVSFAYEKEFGPEQGFLNMMENAQLLWIRRKEGEVWQPPSLFDTQANTSTT